MLELCYSSGVDGSFWAQRPVRLDELAGTVSDRMFSGEEVEGRKKRI